MLKYLHKGLLCGLLLLAGGAHAELSDDYKVILLTENFPPFNMAIDEKNFARDDNIDGISADLVRPLSPVAAGVMDSIPYASTATISLVYRAADVGNRLEGFGFIVPRAEGRDLIAATWTSQKWPHRASEQDVSVRCYLGGVGREAILDHDDQHLVRCVRSELTSIVGLQAEPHYVEVNRWHRAMPQYTIGHLDRLAQLDDALSRFGGLLVTGAGYRGVGIPDCIRDGAETATKTFRYVQSDQP